MRSGLRTRMLAGWMAGAVGLWLAAACCAQTTGAQTTGAPTPDWQTYRYPADGFSASFPAQPEMSKKNVDTQAGTFELRSYIVEIGQVALFIGVCDYGAKVEGNDPDAMLQGAKNGALENSNSHLTREAKISLGVYHGLEFEAESDSAHFYARIYLVGDTLYQTLLVYPIGSPYAGATRFLDSFQLIEREKN